MTTENYDLVIIGTGSGNSVINAEMDGWRIAIVERWTFGGTCLNRGCIPSKLFVYEGNGRFVADRTIEVNGQRIRGEQVVIAAGARSFIPAIHGIDEVPYETSDTIMHIAHQPKHLLVVGGGFIAAELGHVFRSLGSKVSIINRGHHLLVAEDRDVSARYTELAARRFDLFLGTTVHSVHMTADGIGMHLTCSAGEQRIEGDTLLVAAGRLPNGDELNAHAGGIELGPLGNVVVDEFGRTSAPGVWALGDVNGRHQLKHMANGEAKVVQHNLLHADDLRPLDTRPAPHAVFGSPQIGAVGLTEQQAEALDRPVTVVTHSYGGAAYGWALEDDSGFCKLIGDPATRTLLGAHVIGYQASLLAQLLVQGIHLGSTVDEMATGQVWIHPALTEVVEQALLKLIEAFAES